MLYGYGHIEPDPSVYSDAVECIDEWSPSIEVILKTQPDTQLLLSMVSHVVSPKWRNSILYHLRRTALDRRRLVEFGQVIYQLLFPGRYMAQPMVSFGQPVTLKQLRVEDGEENVLPGIIRRAKSLLSSHMDWTKSFIPG